MPIAPGTRLGHYEITAPLGAVLYEMLTGQRAFQRETAAETMTAILKEDIPELQASGRQVPTALDRLVRRCLEKNEEERLQSAHDLAIALEAVSGSEVSATMPAVPARGRWRRVAIGGALLLAGTGLGLLAARLVPARVGVAEPSLPVYRALTSRRGWVD